MDLTVIKLNGAISDGYVLPKGYIAYTTTPSPRLVFSGDILTPTTDSLYEVELATAISIDTGDIITTQQGSDLDQIIVTTGRPDSGDYLLTIDENPSTNEIVIHNYNIDRWDIVTPVSNYHILNNGIKGTGLSNGLYTTHPVDAFIVRLVKLETTEIPNIFSAFTAYLDTTLSILYFPLSIATSETYPTNVVALQSDTVSNSLLTVEKLYISRSGLGVTLPFSLPDNNTALISLSGTSSIANGQTVAVYKGINNYLVAYSQVGKVSYTIDYSSTDGLTLDGSRLPAKYFTGANDLYTRADAVNKFTSHVSLRDISVKAKHNTQKAQIWLCSTIPNAIVHIYIGKSNAITTDNIILSLTLDKHKPVIIDDVKLMFEETIYVKSNQPGTVFCRTVLLSR